MNKKQAVENEVKDILRGLTPSERVKFVEGFHVASERAGKPPTPEQIEWLGNYRKEVENSPDKDKRPSLWDRVKHTAYIPSHHGLTEKKPKRIGKIII